MYVESISSSYRQRRGNVSVMMAIALVSFVAVMALALDVGRVAVARGQLQGIADASALAGVAALRNGMDEEAAKEAAAGVAESNSVLGEQFAISWDDIEVGAYDAETGEIVEWSPTFTDIAVRVTASASEESSHGAIPMAFAGMLGVHTADVRTNAIARVAVKDNVRAPIQLSVVQDASGSFEEEWGEALDGDEALTGMVNNVSIEDDQFGFVAFSEDIHNYREWQQEQVWYKRWYRWRGRWYYYWDWYWDWQEVDAPLTLDLTDYVEGQVGELPEDMDELYENANDADPQGYTNPAVALEWARDQYLEHGTNGVEPVIVLVSDGMPFASSGWKTEQYRQDAQDMADELADMGVRIHTVTLTAEDEGTYGNGGADFEYNASLVRNGGYAFRTHDPDRLRDLLITVGTIEIGKPHLIK